MQSKSIVWLIAAVLIATSVYSYDLKVVCPWDNYTYGSWNAAQGREQGGTANQSLIQAGHCFWQSFSQDLIYQGLAYEIQPTLLINTSTVAYYRFLSDGKPICPKDSLINNSDGTFSCRVPDTNYENSDIHPFVRKVPLYLTHTVNNWTFIPYDYNDQPMQPVSVIFYFSYRLEDMLDIVQVKNEYPLKPILTDQDFTDLGIPAGEGKKLLRYYDLSYKVQDLTVKFKGTSVLANHTRVIISFKPKAEFQHLKLVNFIGKSAAPSLDKLFIEGNFSVLELDPLIAWSFDDEDGEKSSTLDIRGEATKEQLNKIKVIATADHIDTNSSSWGTVFVVLTSVALVFGLVYFSRFQRHH